MEEEGDEGEGSLAQKVEEGVGGEGRGEGVQEWGDDGAHGRKCTGKKGKRK